MVKAAGLTKQLVQSLGDRRSFSESSTLLRESANVRYDLPLAMVGSLAYLTTRKDTDQEIKTLRNYFDAFMINIKIWCAIIISGGKTWPAGFSSKGTCAAFLFFSIYKLD